MHHIVVYRASIADSTLAELTAQTDQILAIQNSHIFPPRDLPLIFAWAGSANLQRWRINTPKLRQVVIPVMPGMDQAALPPDLPFINRLWMNPLVLRREEEIAVEAFQTAGVAQVVIAVLAFLYEQDQGAMHPQPAPIGDTYTLRATGTTTLTANAWSDVALTYDQQLPAGRYAVVGGACDSTNLIAWRLILDNQFPRPGGLGRANHGLEPFREQLMGGLGKWGEFTTVSLPRLQCYATVADTAEELWLQVVKIG